MTTTDTFRAFYAVPFAPATARALEAAARAWIAAEGAGPGPGRWRVSPAERIHLTLKFLGDAGSDLLPRLEEALQDAARAAGPFPLEMGGRVLIKSGSRDPRVLAVGVSDPTGTLPRLAALLDERAAALGFPREARPFRAHVTVARLKGSAAVGRRPARRVSGEGVPPPASGTMDGRICAETAARLVLLRSILGPGGPTYSVVAEVALAGAVQAGAVPGGLDGGGQARTGTRTENRTDGRTGSDGSSR